MHVNIQLKRERSSLKAKTMVTIHFPSRKFIGHEKGRRGKIRIVRGKIDIIKFNQAYRLLTNRQNIVLNYVPLQLTSSLQTRPDPAWFPIGWLRNKRKIYSVAEFSWKSFFSKPQKSRQFGNPFRPNENLLSISHSFLRHVVRIILPQLLTKRF